MPSPHQMAELLQPQAWAIEPSRLNNLLMTLRANAGIFSTSDEPERAYELDGNLAIITISGPLSRYSWWGNSFQRIRQAVADALADPKVAGILLNVNSPGGTVAGTMETAHALREAAEQKPLFAYADGLMASAAYWLCSPAKIIAAPATADIGSIGVVMVHTDWTKWNEEHGLDFTYLHAGEYKVAGNPNSPLSDRDRTYFMQGIGGTYELFVDAVAQGRGLDADAVAATEARVYLAAEAQKQGLIDNVVADLDEFITQIKEELNMNLDQLRAQHPELVRAVEEAARTGMVSEADASARAAEATEQAATAERSRVMGVVGVLVGEEAAAKITTVVDSGATPGDDQRRPGPAGPERHRGPARRRPGPGRGCRDPRRPAGRRHPAAGRWSVRRFPGRRQPDRRNGRGRAYCQGSGHRH